MQHFAGKKVLKIDMPFGKSTGLLLYKVGQKNGTTDS